MDCKYFKQKFYQTLKKSNFYKSRYISKLQKKNRDATIAYEWRFVVDSFYSFRSEEFSFKQPS